MEKKVLLVCILVGILGIISALSGFVAELHRIKKSDVMVYQWECVYPSSPSSGLGYGAAVALLLARFILSFAGGWCGCCRSSTNNGVTISCGARLCSIFSWLASVIALFLLLGGATIANRHGGEMSSDGTTFMCYSVRPGVFAGGAIMAIASVVLGTISYLILSSTRPDASGGTLADNDIEKPPVIPVKAPTKPPVIPVKAPTKPPVAPVKAPTKGPAIATTGSIELNFTPAATLRY